MRFKKLIVWFASMAFFHTPSPGQTGCTLRIDKDNVKVYSCKVANSKIKSIKAVVEVRATTEQVIEFIQDVSNYNNWQYHTVNAHILEQKSETELIYYSEIVAPWPASNRDLVVNLKIEHDKSARSLIVHAQSIPDYISPKNGIVRVPMSKSKWTVKPAGESTLSVEFTMLVDPGGYVPAWLINLVAAEAPYESFRNFKTKIERQ